MHLMPAALTSLETSLETWETPDGPSESGDRHDQTWLNVMWYKVWNASSLNTSARAAWVNVISISNDDILTIKTGSKQTMSSALIVLIEKGIATEIACCTLKS